ncbi:MAG: CDP-alcohol phosphatidyltransferase family protein [Candidatus Azambacteria bacterium]|nr:CDP-alcohol phosphatidyltransferase family protein [Candidatus Azambacteria bacterium]
MEERKYSWREFKADIRKLPNWITFSRVIGFFFLLLPLLRRDYFPLAFAAFLVLAATDWLDGWLARRTNMVTWLGKGLDPIADKVYLIGTMFALGFFSSYPIPGLLLVALEITLLIIGTVAFFGLQLVPAAIGANEKNLDLILGANLFGKTKAVLEIILISFVFLERSNIFQIANDLILFLFWAITFAAMMSILEHLGVLRRIPFERYQCIGLHK